jgi:para-nitrobenzyl esterase
MFDSLGNSWRPFEGKHYDLARQVTSYWTNFVKMGDPNGVDYNGNPLPERKRRF